MRYSYKALSVFGLAFFSLLGVMCVKDASADEISALKSGLYMDSSVGCDGPLAGSISFDGANFSGHKQVCKTSKSSRPRVYSNICVEAMTQSDYVKYSRMTPAALAKVDERQKSEVNIEVTGPESFRLDGTEYKLCVSD